LEVIVPVTAAPLERFIGQKTVLLTTYRRTGEEVGTPVHLVVDGDRAVFRTWHTTGKVKRMNRNPHVQIAPSDIRGRPTGPAMGAEVHELPGDQARQAGRLLAGKYPVMHRLIPLIHRVMRVKTVHYELRPRPLP
jgi:uncharacterized protein